MEIRQLLKKLGHKDLLSAEWYDRIVRWHRWYGGKDKFHDYRVYNGDQYISCTRKTMGMAKKVAEDKADLLLNEKVSITIAAAKGSQAKNETQAYFDAVLEANNFWVRGNQLVELANALGTGAFVEYKDGEEPRIDYVRAECIWPLSWRNGEITECAFASKVTTAKDGELYYINRHVLDEQRKYVIYNSFFDKKGAEMVPPDGVLAEWPTDSALPLFQIITPNIVNNLELGNPMGVSAYANAIDDLETVDLIYDSFYNEFMLGKKRIFLKDGMLKTPDLLTGNIGPIFDPNDTVFYSIPGEDADKIITESNMDLRVTDHNDALQTALDVLSEKCGFGKGYYKFDADSGGVKTAKEVISQNSKLFRRIKKDEIVLRKALIGMARALLFIGGKNADADISVGFDDSIIEDTNATANRAMLEQGAGIIDDVEYFMATRELSEEAAIALVKKIADRKPEEPPPPDMFGGGA